MRIRLFLCFLNCPSPSKTDFSTQQLTKYFQQLHVGCHARQPTSAHDVVKIAQIQHNDHSKQSAADNDGIVLCKN